MEYKKIEGFSSYYVCDNGNVYKEDRHGNLKEVAKVKIPKVTYDGLRIGMQDDTGKMWTKVLNTLVYETFKGKLNRGGKLFYIDGDYTNCSLSNLITDEELLDYYRKHNVKEC